MQLCTLIHVIIYVCVVWSVGTDPEINKKSLEAVVAVLSNARRIAKTFSPEKKAVVEAICSEIETLMRELAELQANGQVRVHGVCNG